MRRVPEFLPPTINAYNNHHANVLGGAVGIGTNVVDASRIVAPTQMKLMLYQSPALIHGLLMTQVKVADDEVERFFFGYRCVACDTVYLVHNRVRMKEDLYEFTQHECDPSDLRRAVRNARDLGRSDNEYIMEGFGGKWWYEDRNKKDRCPLVNDAVYSREQVNHMLARGDINPARADELLNMRYETRDRKK